MAERSVKLDKIRDVLDSCVRPLIFFDDDCDGLMSFLLFYRYIGEGKGVIIKSSPKITEKYIHKVEEYQPDVIFVLDISEVEQEFIDKVKTKVVVIDHHELVDITGANLIYFNPKQYEENANEPTSYWCYNIVKTKKELSDLFLWLGVLGSVADWYIPPFYSEFKEKFSEYVADENGNIPDKIGDILYMTKLGILWHLVSFIIKGNTKDVHMAINIMIKLMHPDEILKEQSSRGKLLYKRYKQLDLDYKKLFSRAENGIKGNLLLFIYPSSDMSFTAEVSNELMYRYPDKLIIVAREKGDEMKCSLRSTKIDLTKAVSLALAGVRGYGGGHPNACGACIKTDDFDRFIENMKEISRSN